MCRWKLLGMQALLAAALAAGPAAAADNTDTGKLTDSQKLDEIKAQLKEVQDSIKSLESLKAEVTKLRSDTTLILGMQDRISKLEKDLDGLRKQLDAAGGPRVSGFGPTAPTGPTGPPPGGRIVLKNTYLGRVSIVVNDKSYQLDPGETVVLDNQPPGNFTYEVLGGPNGVIQPRVNRALAPGDTFPITVFTRY
jgi:hypothetical protein